MKKLILLCALLLSSPALAEDIEVTFSITGVFVSGKQRTGLELDFQIGARYFKVNGGLISDDGLLAPATGTCFETIGAGVFCNLQVDQQSYNITLNSTLVGSISVKDSLGNEIDSGLIEVTTVN
jgi:hypothetical protein